MAIHIEGAIGISKYVVNGYFELIPNEFHNYRPVYRKVDTSNVWLLVAPNGHWYVCSTECKETNVSMGWCYSTDRQVRSPDMVTGWRVAVNGKFTKQLSVSVKGFSPDQWTTQKVSLPSHHR